MSKLSNVLFHVRQNIAWLSKSDKHNSGTIHVLVCMVDHYEPGTGGVDLATETARVEELLCRFPKLGERFRDANGRSPQRTWFYPPHYHRNGSLAKVVQLCDQGHGEIELHLHHGKQVPDTAENLELTLRQCVAEYAEYGIFGSVDGEKRYGFIHGDSALDNSRGGAYCGVNNELSILQRTGCYADFTHPSGPVSGPEMANCVFYACGVDGQPKAYNKGTPAAVGSRHEGLMLVQGPSHPYYSGFGFSASKRTLGGIRIVGDHVPDEPVTRARVDAWVKAGVGISGRDDVVVVKTSTHGADFGESALGGDTENLLQFLDEGYNDGSRYKVHYVTARELYNIVRAIEDEAFTADDPLAARDYEVQPPVYNTAWTQAEASPHLQALVYNTYKG